MQSSDDAPRSAEEYFAANPQYRPVEKQLVDFLKSEDDNDSYSDVFYDLSFESLMEEEVVRLLGEFLELYPNWLSRQVQFHTSKNNIPLVDFAHVIIEMPDYTSAAMRLPLYQFQVKGNSEDLWRIFKVVMKGEKNGASWQRSLDHFTGLHSTNHYHVRRLESAEVKRQAVLDFIARYDSVGIKSIPVALDRGIYPWFMLTSKEAGKAVRLCVVIDKDTHEQNHAQFFELAKLFKNRGQVTPIETSPPE